MCGWGGEGSRGGGGSYGRGGWRPQSTWAGKAGLDSPNAKCPVCDAEVYFIRPERGGSIWLDECGPPWPKHPCMDSEVVRASYPEPVQVPNLRSVMGSVPGWAHHQGDLKVVYDETWNCYAGYFDGGQFAMCIEPRPSLSRFYLSWVEPTRIYGELQYLVAGDGEPEIQSYPVCSYRVIARGQAGARSSATSADWQMLRYWIESISLATPTQTRAFFVALKSALEPLGAGWGRSPKTKAIARGRVEETCQRLGGFDTGQIFRWCGLFVG